MQSAVRCEGSPRKLTQGQPWVPGPGASAISWEGSQMASVRTPELPTCLPHLWEIRQTSAPGHIPPWWALSWWAVYSSFSSDKNLPWIWETHVSVSIRTSTLATVYILLRVGGGSRACDPLWVWSTEAVHTLCGVRGTRRWEIRTAKISDSNHSNSSSAP